MAEDNSSNIGWFLAGLGLGAVIGILYAPKSGKETREQILNSAMEGRDYLTTRAGEGREYVVARANEARESAAAWADRTKENIKQQRESITSAIEAGKSAYKEAVDKKA
jgi:gas vesicle protein